MPSGQPTLRSGLPSTDFPFDGTQKYYERHGSPPRQSLANLKHLQDPLHQQPYKQITGLESVRNPFDSVINYHYNKHIVKTQRPMEEQKPLGTFAHQKQNELLVGRFKQRLANRGAKGMLGLKRQFKILDTDGSGTLDFTEFRRALDDYRVGCTGSEADQLFAIFDRDRNGRISTEEFFAALLSELPSYRRNIIEQAFQQMDSNGDGTLQLEEVKVRFDPTRHPDV